MKAHLTPQNLLTSIFLIESQNLVISLHPLESAGAGHYSRYLVIQLRFSWSMQSY